ncbi:hypothetical protein AKO1_001044 [Acrasis kona]|uniref:Uncharacterized protein n=1 Tax=Acrasis kona TaxID=1008807 RepID=A0AAW2ZBK2_9EUKA
MPSNIESFKESLRSFNKSTAPKDTSYVRTSSEENDFSLVEFQINKRTSNKKRITNESPTETRERILKKFRSSEDPLVPNSNNEIVATVSEIKQVKEKKHSKQCKNNMETISNFFELGLFNKGRSSSIKNKSNTFVLLEKSKTLGEQDNTPEPEEALVVNQLQDKHDEVQKCPQETTHTEKNVSIAQDGWTCFDGVESYHSKLTQALHPKDGSKNNLTQNAPRSKEFSALCDEIVNRSIFLRNQTLQTQDTMNKAMKAFRNDLKILNSLSRHTQNLVGIQPTRHLHNGYQIQTIADDDIHIYPSDQRNKSNYQIIHEDRLELNIPPVFDTNVSPTMCTFGEYKDKMLCNAFVKGRLTTSSASALLLSPHVLRF